jgi:hypothetical protein
MHRLLARHQSGLELRHRVTLDYRVFSLHSISGWPKLKKSANEAGSS